MDLMHSFLALGQGILGLKKNLVMKFFGISYQWLCESWEFGFYENNSFLGMIVTAKGVPRFFCVPNVFFLSYARECDHRHYS